MNFIEQILGSMGGQPSVEERSAPQDAGGPPAWLAQMLQQMQQAPQDTGSRGNDMLRDRAAMGMGIEQRDQREATRRAFESGQYQDGTIRPLQDNTSLEVGGQSKMPDQMPQGAPFGAGRPRSFGPPMPEAEGPPMPPSEEPPMQRSMRDVVQPPQDIPIPQPPARQAPQQDEGFLSQLFGPRAQKSLAAGLATIPAHPGSAFATGARAFGASLSGGLAHDKESDDKAGKDDQQVFDNAIAATDRLIKAKQNGDIIEIKRATLDLTNEFKRIQESGRNMRFDQGEAGKTSRTDSRNATSAGNTILKMASGERNTDENNKTKKEVATTRFQGRGSQYAGSPAYLENEVEKGVRAFASKHPSSRILGDALARPEAKLAAQQKLDTDVTAYRDQMRKRFKLDAGPAAGEAPAPDAPAEIPIKGQGTQQAPFMLTSPEDMQHVEKGTYYQRPGEDVVRIRQ